MGNVLNMLRRGKSRTGGLIAIVAAAIIVPATLYAWGPTRPTYTIEQPANDVTFNSITNNPNIGDERNFVGIREATAPNVWHDEMQVERGKEYVVRMYVHNNAASNLNKVAENTTARFTLPTTTGREVQVDGSITASNASPQMVYDHATFKGAEDFNVAYIPGTLKYENNVFGANGTALPETIFDQRGALLGYDKLDGKIPGCFEYAGYVSFKVKPQFAETPPADFTVQKQVRKEGATDGFKETTAVNPGDKVDYRIEVKNTGGSQLNNVTLKDQLPTGVSFVPGTVKILDTNNPSGAFVQDGDKLVTDGINIGHFNPGGNAYIIFKAKVASNDQLPECDINKLVNKASAQPEGQNPKEDTADVTVPKECQPEKIQVCDLTTKQIITIDEADFDATKHSKNLEDCKEKNIIVCELATKKIVTIKESAFDASKHSKNIEDCKDVPSQIIVCDLTTKQIITIDEADFDATKHSKNLEDCKTPVENCPIPGKEHLPAYSAECETPVTPTPPTTPTELPQTGNSDGMLTIAGLATLALVLGYAVTSRRTLG